MIIFNLGALIQTIVVVLIGFVLYQLGIIDYIDNFQLNSNNKGILACYGVYLIAVITHKFGVKGRIFFVPVWIICLFLIFITNLAYKGDILDSKNDRILTYINYVVPIILFFMTFRWLNISTNKEIGQVENNENIN